MDTMAENVKVEMALETMTIAQLTEMGKELGLTFPNKTRKAEIISGIIAKREEIQAEETKRSEEEEEQRIQAEIASQELLEQQRLESLDNPNLEYSQEELDALSGKADLSAFKNDPQNIVPSPPLSTQKKGATLTPEEIKARVEAARKENEEAEELRKAAESSKAKYVSWEATTDELVKRYGKIGYAVGLVIQAAHRLEKELKVSEQVIDGMGESWDIEAANLAKEAAIEGYAKSWDTYKFPSKAMRGLRGEALQTGIWNEIISANPSLPLIEYLEELPQMGDYEEFEEEEGEEEEEED
jgi:hypothetical protein